MAVDKKSDFVGDHGGAFIDNDNMRRQFTYIDHDVKTKIVSSVTSDEEKAKIKQDLASFRQALVERITAIPAVYCNQIHADYTVRGDVKRVQWNLEMLNDNGVPLDVLRAILTLAENTRDLVGSGITP